MKLFQQLLLAPAALGLLAPMAVSASELNIDGVNKYAGSEEQVTSITQFSDVQPTEWAYQALSNLVERYGCVAGYPDGTFRGKKPLSRWEAAALLNACLDRITEVTDELRRLMKEFETELAVLKGRVDGLEAKVGELEANQFSTTTKLKGTATFVIGANSYGGDSGRVDAAQALQGSTAFNYDLRLDLDTSFTGKDLLRTRLRAGNFGDSPFGAPVVGLNALEVGFEGPPGPDSVMINRLFYQFPVGSSFTVTAGPRVRQDDMLAVWPSVYPADTVLDIFTYAGAPGTYSLNLGAGGGLWWKSGGFSASVNYVAANGNVGAPDDRFAVCGGIGNDCSQQTGTAQIAYTGTNFGLAVAYNYSTPNGVAGLYGGNGTPTAVTAYLNADSVNSVGISGYWQPSNSGFIPSISAGWGINAYTYGNGTGAIGEDFGDAQSQSWYVGLQWTDVFIKGNAAGMAVGQPTFLTQTSGDSTIDPRDGQFAWEWWYKFQVTDNISVTPAIYYLSAPLGQDGSFGSNNRPDLNNFGGLLKTTFKF
ncbi:iron uptake porin [Synechococcus sp. CS-1325]|uniref:iron uptake porin n=1 Tax=unclassified Synechococcus TaxID=2626047 RepID=UPI000DAFD218|nr:MULTISPECIES: iron uptake porin [unclassified Synechococcus]MCT0199969.1 iron uptake porin [Synechococcus sp. CS-1325]MCT0212166.1 iron uptake porin [Synechococcus sp. CS-1326]MCT0233363.1 iron uptake porin [Synechococcus sp. CS-1327]PZU98649.1 MAG: porin [Cyanobium sp.]